MSNMLVDRRFLGWERPILQSVAEQLLDAADDGGPLDLSRMLVVFPGARAGRRLKELLGTPRRRPAAPCAPPRSRRSAGSPRGSTNPSFLSRIRCLTVRLGVSPSTSWIGRGCQSSCPSRKTILAGRVVSSPPSPA